MADVLRPAMIPVPVFVYGSLKRGEGLNPYWMDEVDEWEEATALGHRLMTSPAVNFPFMVRERKAHAQGEVAWFTNLDTLAKLARMEEKAGYVTQWITVRLPDMSLTSSALSFVYPFVEPDFRPVEGDKWSGVMAMAG